MKFLRSLHVKIVLGYGLVGGLSVMLVIYALIQFRVLENEIARQHEVTAFYDAVRHARRLEKNFLLYQKREDLDEAVEQANFAQASFDKISYTTFLADNNDSELASVALYPKLLVKLREATDIRSPSPELLREAYAAGSALIKFGERLDLAAQSKIQKSIQQHDVGLLRIIWAALVVAILTGFIVTRSVIRPLREIEGDLRKVAKGEVERVDGHQAEKEVESLTRSINNTLQELEFRQTLESRSSRLMALGTMLSGVAHELNNPLSNISSSCQILEEEWQELPDRQVQQLLAQVDGQVVRAKNIVATLLNFSANQPLKRKPENVRALVTESLALLTNQISPEIKVILHISESVCINVDHLRFQQVLLNIIKNAAEATHTVGTIHIEARKDDLPEGRGTTLEIEDDGEGISAEYLKKIFDPFYTTKSIGKGSGLGLFVAHEIVVQHGGVISVDSQPSHGTRFWLHIPDADNLMDSHD